MDARFTITNMAIETLTAKQEENSLYISDFSVTLKQIRTTSTADVAYDSGKYQSYNGLQAQPVEESGKVEGKKSSSSFAYQAIFGDN